MIAEARRIALYGGSFDPPHVAHVLAVAWVLSAAPIDEVWVLPVFRHRFGKHFGASFNDRVALCGCAFGVFGPRVSVREDEAELAREGSDGRTIALVERLLAKDPGLGLRLVLGTDALAERQLWAQWDRLIALAPPLVLGRPGHPAPVDVEASPDLPEVSSTVVRARLLAGASCEGLVPRTVLAHIASEGLYARRERA